DVLKRNNPNYNKTIYHPNALRLYVRGKLAVDNLMTYLGSTQAFSNYIEGEIRFDVLDDDRFEDISTSSREGYKKDDPRIEKLLEIVGKIVTRLIAERISARDNLNKLVAVYKEEQQQKEAAEKKLLEEQLQESKRQVSSAIAEKERVETEIKKERKRIDYIIGVSNVKDNNILPSMHSVYNLALLSKKKISKLEEYVHTLPAQAHNILENLGETNNQILYISKAISKANYLVDSERKKIDLIDFFAEYIYRIGKKLYGSKIKTDIQDRLTSRLLVTASPLMLSSILENLIGNSIKAKAENFIIEFTENDQFYKISFIDDGKGLDPSITDINRIFEFGVTTTSGAGLGLFYVKKYISDMEGELTVKQNETKGLTFTAIWRK
ncbi:MAG: HAMP domain-containing histidine kinase, partial [Clostridiales bacterium]|nr:HAMP domain-containing histidine kinase [Clostridiales bacterium]